MKSRAPQQTQQETNKEDPQLSEPEVAILTRVRGEADQPEIYTTFIPIRGAVVDVT